MNCKDHGEGHHMKSSCGCPCHKMNGILIVLIGATVLAGNMEWVDAHMVGRIWPVLLILLGLKKAMGKGKCNCCRK